MSRSNFPGSPFFLGFGEVERLLELAGSNVPDGYPSLNIEQFPDDRPVHPKEHVFLHKGIAARPFMRCFALASDLEVQSASLSNGLLRIELCRIRKASEIRQIPISIV